MKLQLQGLCMNTSKIFVPCIEQSRTVSLFLGIALGCRLAHGRTRVMLQGRRTAAAPHVQEPGGEVEGALLVVSFGLLLKVGLPLNPAQFSQDFAWSHHDNLQAWRFHDISGQLVLSLNH